MARCTKMGSSHHLRKRERSGGREGHDDEGGVSGDPQAGDGGVPRLRTDHRRSPRPCLATRGVLAPSRAKRRAPRSDPNWPHCINYKMKWVVFYDAIVPRAGGPDRNRSESHRPSCLREPTHPTERRTTEEANADLARTISKSTSPSPAPAQPQKPSPGSRAQLQQADGTQSPSRTISFHRRGNVGAGSLPRAGVAVGEVCDQLA